MNNDYANFLKNYSAWLSHSLNTNIQYSILIDTSGSMDNKDINNISRIEYAKNAVKQFIDEVHIDNRNDKGSIYTFNTKIYKIISSNYKNILINKTSGISINSKSLTSFWQAVFNLLTTQSSKSENDNIGNYMIVFTDGIDNYSFSPKYKPNVLMNDINKLIEHNNICFSKIRDLYIKNHNLPLLYIIALSSKNENIVWKSIIDLNLSTEYENVIPISISTIKDIKDINYVFTRKSKEILKRCVRFEVASLWLSMMNGKRLKGKDIIILPGLIISVIIVLKKLEYNSMISHSKLINIVMNFLMDLKDYECFDPVLSQDLDCNNNYIDFIENFTNDKIEYLSKNIIQDASIFGWIKKINQDYKIMIQDNSPADIILNKYFLQNLWQSDEKKDFFDKKIMREIMALCDKKGIEIQFDGNNKTYEYLS